MQNSKLDRAKQFMPFAALRGYYDMIKNCERIKEERRELSDSEAEVLSEKINSIKKGDIVEITYYNVDAYEKIQGYVTKLDKNYKILAIIKTKINFCDIIDIRIIK